MVTAPELPELAGTPVRASLADQPAAMLGQGCLAPGQLKATFGTGCFLYLNTGAAPRPSRHGLLTTIAWQAFGATTYALDAGIFAAGSLVAWLRDDLGLVAEAELDALAGSVADPRGVVCVPALAGLAAPHWRRDARAAFLGMGLGVTRAHLVRAALEGIACRVAEVVGAMQADAGLTVPALRVDGGLTRSAVLMQLCADLTGVVVEVAAEAEATALGAALLAARAAGLDLPPRLAAGPRYEPRIDAAERAARLARFSAATQAVLQFVTAAGAAGAPGRTGPSR